VQRCEKQRRRNEEVEGKEKSKQIFARKISSDIYLEVM
jgi:hypothetical protein